MTSRTDTIVFTRVGEVALRKEELRPLDPGCLRVETVRTAISAGTERLFLSGDGLPDDWFPFRPGYSAAGYVAEIAPGVTNFAIGDRVFALANHAAECVVSENQVIAIPDAVSFEQACFASIASMAIYAVRRANFQLGDPVAIIGQGLIGLIASSAARYGGAMPLIGLDIDPERLDLARAMGVDIALDPRDGDALAAALERLPGGGVAAAIELSGSGPPLDLALRITRQRGTVFAGSAVREFNGNFYGEHWMKGITITSGFIGSRPQLLEQHVTSIHDWPPRVDRAGEYFATGVYTSMDDIRTFFEMVATGRLDIAPLITGRYKPSDAATPFRRLLSGDRKMIGAVFEWR